MIGTSVLTSDLEYRLPEGLIAQRPASPRDSSRLMVVDAKTGGIQHHVFRDLPRFLGPGDALVLNETKVLPARLRVKRPGGGAAELLFLRELPSGAWEVMARPGRRLRHGMVLSAGDDILRVAEPLEEGRWAVAGADVPGLLRRRGRMPLPPYVRATPEAERGYQTVYARNEGSAAAPTAGLHFTERVLEAVAQAGAEVARITLHVGAGTFLPLRGGDPRAERLHAEWGEVSPEAAALINEARPAGGRIVAVGTTALRLLETAALHGDSWQRPVRPFRGLTDLFLLPGHRFRSADALMTNFHLPRSTLFMLVCAFSGAERMRSAYAHAIAAGYRFYSYGDASLLFPAEGGPPA